MKKRKAHQNNPVRIPLILLRLVAAGVIMAVLLVVDSSIFCPRCKYQIYIS
jgi:hypothetical protein